MPLVIVENTHPQITTLTLNRPERRNALTIELMQELTAALDAASADEKRRVLILRGAGQAFCAGLDLKEAAATENAIAAIHGAAVAGGAGIMSACDLVVAAERTKIGYPEAKRGLVAGLVMTFLRRQLRERDIRELLFTSELIDAARAREIGLVNRVVPPNELQAEAMKIANAVLQGAPEALAQTKRLIEELWSSAVKEDVDLALKYHMQARESDEAREGIDAFNEKRPPKWTK